MDDRLSRLEASLEQLAARCAGLEQRLAALEDRTASTSTVRSEGAPTATLQQSDARPDRPWESDLGSIVALVGRTLVVLAGAYLLRALTDSGRLAAGPGVLLGMAYALSWIILADRAGARGRTLSAAFHGVAFVLIALPLLFEATTRFRFLDTATSAAGLGGFAAVALAVAARTRLEGFAWVTTLGGLATAVALMLVTATLGPYAVFLVLLGVATLWMGYVLDWTLLRWPVALVADLTIVILSGGALTSGAADTPGVALGVQVLLLAAYLGSFAARTLFLNRDVIPFEVAQSVAAITVGLGGAAYVTHTTGVGALPLGIATLVLAAGGYTVAVVFVERRQGRRRNFYFYTSTALIFGMAGCALILPRAALALAYAALGLASAWAGRLTSRVTFHAHGAVYLVAAVLVSGLLPHVLYGLGVPAPPAEASAEAMLVILAAGLASVWPLGSRATEGPPQPMARVPRLVVLVLALGGLLSVAVGWLTPAIAGEGAAAAHPGVIATLRTALLVAAVLALAWAGRALEFVEGRWLVYPLLILTGLKFAFEDFPTGQPATLFVGFALYGLALIAGPWLSRRSGGGAETASRSH
jgi:hypothetical protein